MSSAGGGGKSEFIQYLLQIKKPINLLTLFTLTTIDYGKQKKLPKENRDGWSCHQFLPKFNKQLI